MSPGPAWRQVKTKTWFTADLHLGHRNIIDYCNRPFATVEQMNETIVARWNERVAPEDTAWLLGDVAMGRLDKTLPLLARLNGRKYLVAGNHDRPFHGYKPDGTPRPDYDKAGTARRWAARYRDEAGFTAVVTGEAVRRTGHAVRVPLLGGPPFGHPVVLVSHFPYTGESREGVADRYAEYRPKPPKRGPRPWLVCGHVHDAWAIDAAQRQINVGVDVWDFAPVAADELAALIKDFSE
jgi:calcineurin-like phosphoesterase family protein